MLFRTRYPLPTHSTEILRYFGLSLRYYTTAHTARKCSNEILHRDDCSLAHCNKTNPRCSVMEFPLTGTFTVQHLSPLPQNVQNLDLGQLEPSLAV